MPSRRTPHGKSPVGLGGPPATTPRRIRSRADLRAFQRLVTHLVIRPLGPDDTLAARWRGRPVGAVAGELIKPNDRLTSVERLQIYARCYWYRVTESVYDDCPALRALLGERRFAALVGAFLARYPSRSFTLRNLCERLPAFIREQPRWTAPDTRLAEAIAQFEWAQTVAFDGAALPPLPAGAVARTPPTRLRLRLQPHLTLLAADWPVDAYVAAVKQRDALRTDASNTVAGARRARRVTVVRRPAPRATHLVVHRHGHRVFHKRIPAPAFAILRALAAGRTLAQAVTAAGSDLTAEQIRDAFTEWMQLGWLCPRPR